MMDQDQLEFAISQFLDGTLPPAERAALIERVETDPVARQLLETYRRMDAELRTGLRTPQVNWDRLAERISARVAEADAAPPVLRLTLVRRLVPYALAASVLLVVGIVSMKVFSGEDPQSNPVRSIAQVQGPEAERGEGPEVADVSIGPAPNLSREWRAADAVVSTPNRVIWIAGGANPGEDTQRMPY